MKSLGFGYVVAWALTLAGLLGGTGCSPAPPAIGLHQAVLKDDVRIVEQHLAAKTPLDTKDANGWTPLHLAALRGNVAIAKALLAAGADPAATGAMGKTPLDLAREQKRSEVIELLQQAGTRASPGRRGLVDGGLGVSEVLESP